MLYLILVYNIYVYVSYFMFDVMNVDKENST